MDPDANLAEIRKLVGLHEKGAADRDDGERLAELVDSLDDWLCRGGFLPEAWSKGR